MGLQIWAERNPALLKGGVLFTDGYQPGKLVILPNHVSASRSVK